MSQKPKANDASAQQTTSSDAIEILKEDNSALRDKLKRMWFWPETVLGVLILVMGYWGYTARQALIDSTKSQMDLMSAMREQLKNSETAISTARASVEQSIKDADDKRAKSMLTSLAEFQKQLDDGQKKTANQLIAANRLMALVSAGNSQFRDRHDSEAAYLTAKRALDLYEETNVGDSSSQVLREAYPLAWTLAVETAFATRRFDALQKLSQRGLDLSRECNSPSSLCLKERANFYLGISKYAHIVSKVAALAPRADVELSSEFRDYIRDTITSFKNSADTDGRLGFTNVRVATLHLLLEEYQDALRCLDDYKSEVGDTLPATLASRDTPERQFHNALADTIELLACFPLGKSDLTSWARCQLNPGVIGQAEGKLFEDFFRCVCVIRNTVSKFRVKHVGVAPKDPELASDNSGALGRFCVEVILELRHACNTNPNKGCVDCERTAASDVDFPMPKVIQADEVRNSPASIDYRVFQEVGVIPSGPNTPITNRPSLGAEIDGKLWMSWVNTKVIMRQETRTRLVDGKEITYTVTIPELKTETKLTAFNRTDELPSMPYVSISAGDREYIQKYLAALASVPSPAPDLSSAP